MTCVKKDTNVLLLIKAFTSISVISSGLRDKFKNYGSLTIAEILGRFKEKKVTVVSAGRMAADCCAKTIKFPDQVCGFLKVTLILSDSIWKKSTSFFRNLSLRFDYP